MPRKLSRHKALAVKPKVTSEKDCRVILRFWQPTGKGAGHFEPGPQSNVLHGYTVADAYRFFGELEECLPEHPSYRTELIIERRHPDRWEQLEAWEYDPQAKAWYRFTKGQWQ